MNLQFIDVGKEYGPVCGHRELSNNRKDAKHLRTLLEEAIQKREKIQLSFKEVKVLTPSFADEAFGKLAEKFGLESLNTYLEFEDVPDHVAQRINRAVDFRLQRKEALNERKKTPQIHIYQK